MKKILTLLLAIAMLISSMSMAVFAADSGKELYIKSSDGTDFYADFDELPPYDDQNGSKTMGAYITLQKDVKYDFIYMSGNPDSTIPNFGGSTIDLNGHTLTLTGKQMEDVFVAVWLEGKVIKNGTLNIESSPACSIVVANYDSPQVEFEDLNIISSQNAIDLLVDFGGGVLLKNCSMKNITSTGGKITLESGSYTGVEIDDTAIKLAEGSKAVTVADTDATVIASSSTAAIVVKDGMAYTYDDIDAAKAAQAGGKLLIKQADDSFVEDVKPTVTIKTGNAIARTGANESIATGFVTDISGTGVEYNTIKWDVTSSKGQKGSAEYTLDPALTGNIKLGLIINGLLDEQATAKATVNGTYAE